MPNGDALPALKRSRNITSQPTGAPHCSKKKIVHNGVYKLVPRHHKRPPVGVLLRQTQNKKPQRNKKDSFIQYTLKRKEKRNIKIIDSPKESSKLESHTICDILGHRMQSQSFFCGTVDVLSKIVSFTYVNFPDTYILILEMYTKLLILEIYTKLLIMEMYIKR